MAGRNKKRNVVRIIEDDNEEEYLAPLSHDIQGENGNSKRSVRLSVGKHVRLSISNRTPTSKLRKRRRSSARFLRLSGRFDNVDDPANKDTGEETQEHLSEMYRQAVRLNAENKINVGNSWKLKLIDNIDKFLGDDEDSSGMIRKQIASKTYRNDGKENIDEPKRVNFTKASCTLDASVKIYSYRVDDVHLTSYKVLANLNRTDGGKKSDVPSFVDAECCEQQPLVVNKRISEHVKVDTLETNLVHLNAHKLDKAYDIDPIFHKMSQKFDEGGAKGLLLVNLVVASDGCRIVLDSKEDSEGDNTSCSLIVSEEVNETPSIDIESETYEERDIDISCFKGKLNELMTTYPIESCQLVPQLEDLRSQYFTLEAHGFVQQKGSDIKSKRYANNEAEERAAEEDIHREAVERSRLSMSKLSINDNVINTSVLGSSVICDDDFSPHDFGCGVSDANIEDNELNNILLVDDNAENYCSLSFHESDDHAKGRTVNFLDTLCSEHVFNKDNAFDYFDLTALANITSGNMWAGSAHWKKTGKLSKNEKMHMKEIKTPNKQSKRRTNRNEPKRILYVNLMAPRNTLCIDALLTEKSMNKPDSTDITKSAKNKQMKEKNLLPADVGIGLVQLLGLFLRPDEIFTSARNDVKTASRKSVSFYGVDTFGDNNCDGSFRDADSLGPALNIANDTIDGTIGDTGECVIENLEGVRKVTKTRVSHATVAKKVDVKRLKRVLWAEVKAKTEPAIKDVEIETIGDHTLPNKSRLCSFKDTVENLAGSHGQDHVSLAFYFICMLHLANEKVLCLENDDCGLSDFVISRD